MKKIEKKITAFKVKDDGVIEPRKKLADRDEVLQGGTYKIKPVTNENAFYITINDFNRKPHEIFVNSKCPESFSWLHSYTRMLSAIMRENNDITFIIDELKGVIDPKGGYYVKKLGFVPSVQAHIALILEKHIRAMI